MKQKYLTGLDDSRLILNIKNESCNDSLKELIQRHSAICFSIGKKFSNTSGIDLNELTDNRDWIIYSAALSFDDSKGSKFSTWLANQVKYFCLNLRNKTMKHKCVDTDSETLSFLINQYHVPSHDRDNKKEIINTIIDFLDQVKDKNIKDSIYYRYLSNKDRILNYSEVGEILNVTPQTVLNWHNKFINLAKKKLTSISNVDMI
jgi:DNA-directed RNA polymerase sigma subunit (sigma70/sigma32)